MENKISGKIKLLITIGIIFLFVWYLVLSPMITFHNNEKTLENAARRYFELNSNELPTGERVKTVTLQTLYQKAFIESDLYMPHSKNICSVTDSWVKVKRVNDEYKYYTYLDCGVLSSTIDHKGPTIKLNGDSEVTVSRGEEYKEPGVKSVVDNSDGKMDVSEVVVKSNVNTSEVGEYEVTYVAVDSLSNKTTVTRKVNVVQTLRGTIKEKLAGKSNFTGNPEDNYIRLSNMLFRVFGLDNDGNVVIVSDSDIANVSYNKLDDWLDYYYEHLNDKTRDLIVESKYCNMTLSDTTLDTTQCNSYTKKKKVYIPSVVEVNKVEADTNFMKPSSISWVSNNKSKEEAYVTRRYFRDEMANNSGFLAYDVTQNYGVRPMMTISGDALIVGGEGLENDPYTFGDVKKAKSGSYVNERFTGEYIDDGTTLWRIIDVMNDGTTKVISNDSINGINESIYYYIKMEDTKITYNPKDKSSLGYYINNTVTKYVDTSNLATHTIKVPIYKNKIIYGEEIDTKEYKVMLSAPNMFEMFSAMNFGPEAHSYWLINTSKTDFIGAAIYDAGVPVNEEIASYQKYGIRVVAYLKKSATVSSGKGTFDNPYIIK